MKEKEKMVGIVHNYSFGVHSLVTVIQNYFVSGQTELKTNSVAKFDRFVVRYDLPCIYEYIQYFHELCVQFIA